MKYSDIRNTIKTGDLLAWSEGGTWSSWKNFQLNLVRMGTMSDYNHVGIAYVEGGRVFVVDAVVPYVRIFPLSRLTPFRYIRTPFFTTDADVEFLLSYVGKPYSKWEAIKAAFTNDTNNNKVIQCAKLANEFYGRFNKQYLELRDTPMAVVNLTLDVYPTEEIHITE
jgi:hypothetical protein